MKIEAPYVYVLSPVRQVTPDQAEIIAKHVDKLKELQVRLFNPVKDAPQEDKTGYNIVMAELAFMEKAAKNGGRVDILWNMGGKASEGSRVDLGMAYALGLRFNLVEIFNKDNPSGPGLAYKIISEIISDSETDINYRKGMNLELTEIAKTRKMTINWDIEMVKESREWQRIILGLALGSMARYPDLKIKMGELRGVDPEGIKSYPKVIKEIERRQNTGESLSISQ